MAYKLGLIGPGIAWRTLHKPALDQLTDLFTISAVAMSREQRVPAGKEQFPGLPVYGSYRDMLNDADIDGALVLTPAERNAEVTMEVLRSGYDSFSEKPIGHTLEAAKAVLDTERETGRRVFLLEQKPYNLTVQKIKEMLADRPLGRLTNFEYSLYRYSEVGENDRRGFFSTNWRTYPQFEGGYILDGGLHDISIFLELFGKPKSISCFGLKFRETHGDFGVTGMLQQYADGMFGVLTQSEQLGIRGENLQTLTLFGERGHIRADFTAGEVEMIDLDGNAVRVRVPQVSDYYMMWRSFAERMQKGEAPYFSSQQGADAVEIAIRAVHAAKEGSIQQL